MKTSKHFTSKHKTSPPWNGRRLVHSKEMIGHRAGRSPCAHSIGKFFLCYIVLFVLETSAPGLSGHYWKKILLIMMGHKRCQILRYLVSKTLYFCTPNVELEMGSNLTTCAYFSKFGGSNEPRKLPHEFYRISTVPTASASHEVGCPRKLGSRVRITQYIPLYQYK